jgi:hypothetical protein
MSSPPNGNGEQTTGKSAKQEHRPSHRRLYQHYRPKADKLLRRRDRPLCADFVAEVGDGKSEAIASIS